MSDEGLRSVVARAATGDEIAFARIVAAHHDDMARVAFVVCGDVDLAQEAVQAAWPKAWAKLASIRDPARLRPWLISIAANEAKQLRRSRSRRLVREIPMPVDDGSGRSMGSTTTLSAASARASASASAAMGGDPAARAGSIDLANALATLDDLDRTFVALRYAAGLTSDEIGHIVGMTGGGVRARLARILDRLRRELSDDQDA